MSNFAFAGFVEGTFWCGFADDPVPQVKHVWSFNCTESCLNLAETLHAIGTDGMITMTGQTDQDPMFLMDEVIDNDTLVDWTSFDIQILSGSANFNYTYTPLSNFFGSTTQTPTDLTFLSPLVVHPGDSVEMKFKIQVTSTGPFTLTVSQTAIPEPATITLLCIGALALLRKK
ncbi:MAG: PEP-CTERM sorting domain-containing protein [Sedimentisphaerales bacterium]